MIQIRPYDARDAGKVPGYPPAEMPVEKGITLESRGTTVGIAGLYRAGEGSPTLVAFFQLADELRYDKRAIVRGMHMMRKMYDAEHRVIALADPCEYTAHNFLTHVGFVYAGKGEEEDIYVWPSSHHKTT